MIFSNNAFVFVGSQSRVEAFRLSGCEATPCVFRRGDEYYGEMDVVAGTVLIDVFFSYTVNGSI